MSYLLLYYFNCTRSSNLVPLLHSFSWGKVKKLYIENNSRSIKSWRVYSLKSPEIYHYRSGARELLRNTKDVNEAGVVEQLWIRFVIKGILND